MVHENKNDFENAEYSGAYEGDHRDPQKLHDMFKGTFEEMQRREDDPAVGARHEYFDLIRRQIDNEAITDAQISDARTRMTLAQEASNKFQTPEE